jgi:molybdate transport system ATP-binding protein
VLYVSHALDEVARLADHLVLMDAGRVLRRRPAGRDAGAAGPAAGARRRRRRGARRGAWWRATIALAAGCGWLWRRRLPACGPGTPACQVGQRVRLRVLARDVSLARAAADRHQHRQPVARHGRGPALALVRVRIGTAAHRSWRA